MIPDLARISRFGVRAAALCQPMLFQPTSSCLTGTHILCGERSHMDATINNR
eukprot:COSAG03_NODE_8521_length_795_cov_2.045977_2_plen_51_part_01